MSPTPTGERLASLRELMKKNGSLDAYLVVSEDAHASEYISECDMRRVWISGFTGSAGTALILEKEAHLFTDGRYHQQAAQELDTNWTLQKSGLPGVKTWADYLATLPPGSKIGFDPTLLSISLHKVVEPKLKALSSSLVPVTENLVDLAWGSERPKRPAEPVILLGKEYSGESASSKIERVRKEMVEKKCEGMIVSQLDEVAWLLNLRGQDIAFNPVFFAFVYLPVKEAPTLFVNIDQLPQSVYDELVKIGILIEPYDSVTEHLSKVAKGLKAGEKCIVPDRTNFALASAMGLEKLEVYRGPICDFKAVKNATEMQGFRDSHLRDGSALIRYFSWLESQLNAGAEVTESGGADKLEEFRKQLLHFRGLSFDTISSTGANASIIHYHPSSTDPTPISKDAIYLCDSGAQFTDGTTDTTRTMHFGTPTPQEIRAYTRVLQGHIAIDSLVFPKGTTGYILDAFARQPLWSEGLDYRHGTSHGVGHFLNVHEGPQSLSTRISSNESKLVAGNVLSNEPGFYLEGKFGVRIENVVMVQPAQLENDFGEIGWLQFENVTMVPIQTKLIDPSLLTEKELHWVNALNKQVRDAQRDTLVKVGDLEAVEWLEKEMLPLSRR